MKNRFITKAVIGILFCASLHAADTGKENPSSPSEKYINALEGAVAKIKDCGTCVDDGCSACCNNFINNMKVKCCCDWDKGDYIVAFITLGSTVILCAPGAGFISFETVKGAALMGAGAGACGCGTLCFITKQCCISPKQAHTQAEKDNPYEIEGEIR